jgi:hypothetical protein
VNNGGKVTCIGARIPGRSAKTNAKDAQRQRAQAL